MSDVIMLMHDFRGGGAERVAIALANDIYEKGNSVSIVVVKAIGPMINDVNKNVRIINLNRNRLISSFWKLSRVIKNENPKLIISHMTHVNVMAILSSLVVGYKNKLVVVEHNEMDKNYEIKKGLFIKLAYRSTWFMYKYCRKVVAVSNGVKNSILSFTKLDDGKVEVIYNPVVSEKINSHVSCNPCTLHEFFDVDTPVYIAVGSLTQQKNFSLLLDAFKKTLDYRDSRLLILGEGNERDQLFDKIKRLNLCDKVELIGYRENVYDYISSANALVMSSSWEGLPTVLIEALALNTKVVSTDCKSGPKEILEDGKYGILVPVNNVNLLAKAMNDILFLKFDNLKERGSYFQVSNASEKYMDLI